MARKQCKKCPWRVDVDPHDIPNGYSEAKHQNLRGTIATGDMLGQLGGARGLRIMACHDTPQGSEQPCVGWLVHQLGPGNNLPLRLACYSGRIDHDVETVGAQHESFEATLPKKVEE